MKNYARILYSNFKQHMFWLFEAILTNIQTYEEIRIKQGLSYMYFCPLWILYGFFTKANSV